MDQVSISFEQSGPASSTSQDSQRLVQQCWACNCDVYVPTTNTGAYASLYQCGHCFAYNEYHPPNASPPLGTPSNSRFQWLKQFSCTFDTVIAKLGALLVVFVIFLVLLLTGVGLTFIVPRISPNRVCTVIINVTVIWLVFNLLFNYMGAVFSNPGRGPDHVQVTLEPGNPVPPHAFENVSFCQRCQFIKPPFVHHCSTCKQCVVDMDHHCPYLNNCVGRGNLRYFILFLGYAVVCSGLGMVCTGYALLSAPPLPPVPHRHWYSHIPVFGVPLYIADVMPRWQLVAVWILIICTTVSGAVGALFAQQMRFVLSADSQINKMKRRRQGKRRAVPKRAENLKLVFGSGWAGWWVLPQIGWPEGCRIFSYLPDQDGKGC